MRICINAKVFEWTFAVFCHEYGYINNLFWKNGGWRLTDCIMQFFYKYFFNRISSFWTDILTWTWMRICINVNVFLINILLSSTVNMVIVRQSSVIFRPNPALTVKVFFPLDCTSFGCLEWISRGYPWAIWEIQDGRQDGRHCQEKIKSFNTIHKIFSNITFSTKCYTRNPFLRLFL